MKLKFYTLWFHYLQSLSCMYYILKWQKCWLHNFHLKTKEQFFQCNHLQDILALVISLLVFQTQKSTIGLPSQRSCIFCLQTPVSYTTYRRSNLDFCTFVKHLLLLDTLNNGLDLLLSVMKLLSVLRVMWHPNMGNHCQYWHPSGCKMADLTGNICI